VFYQKGNSKSGSNFKSVAAPQLVAINGFVPTAGAVGYLLSLLRSSEQIHLDYNRDLF